MNPYMNNNQNSVYPMRLGQYIPWDLTVFRNISIAGTCTSAYISYIKTTVGLLYCVLSCVGADNTRTDVIIDMLADNTQILHIGGITIVVSTGGISSLYLGSGSWLIDPTCIGQTPPDTGYMYVTLDGARFSTHAVLQLQVTDSAYYQVDGSSFIVRYKGSRPATLLRIDYLALFNGVLSINGVSGSRLDLLAVYPVSLCLTARGSFIYVTINCALSAKGNRLGCNSKVPA